MSYNPLRRGLLENRLRDRALAGDSTAFLFLRSLRRLWRAQDTARKTNRNTTITENHHA